MVNKNFSYSILIGISLLFLLNMNFCTGAIIPGNDFFENIQNYTIKSDITRHLFGFSFSTNELTRNSPVENRILQSVFIPEKFNSIMDLEQNSTPIDIIVENYSSPPLNSKSDETYMEVTNWKNIELDWITGLESNGTILVSSRLNDPVTKRITIFPGTTEKGILLYSSLLIPDNNTQLLCSFHGNMVIPDTLLLFIKDNANSNLSRMFRIPNGEFSHTCKVNLSEFTGKRVSVVLGAYYSLSQEKPWTIENFSLKTLEISSGFNNTEDNSILKILPTPESNSFITKEKKIPEISKIWPNSVINLKPNFTIQIYGDSIEPGAKAFINNSDIDILYSREFTIHSTHNVSAVFSNMNLPSEIYSVGILNPDGEIAILDDALTIQTPNIPVIEEIWPNSGQNTGIINISELNVTQYSYGDQIFLSRTGFHPVYASHIEIKTNNMLSCEFDLTGEPVGYWNLTVKKENGKYDVCVDCFSITGSNDQYYKYLKDMKVRLPIENDDSDIEGIAIDNSDNIIISEISQNIIQKYAPDGTLLYEWGGLGNESGKFSHPTALAISSTGSIYIVDTGNERIQKFDQNGYFITSWGGSGSENGQFLNPLGIAVDKAENIFVSDTNNHRIQKFDQNGIFIKKWGSQGGYDGQFSYPASIISGFNDTLFVIDKGNDRVQNFDTMGSFISKWGTSGFENGEFLTPGSIAKDFENNLYITDLSQNQIQKFDPEGIFLTKWSLDETNGNTLLCPDQIAVNNSGYVYVVDCINNRIQIFEPIRDNQFFTPPEEKIPELFTSNNTFFTQDQYLTYPEFSDNYSGE